MTAKEAIELLDMLSKPEMNPVARLVAYRRLRELLMLLLPEE